GCTSQRDKETGYVVTVAETSSQNIAGILVQLQLFPLLLLFGPFPLIGQVPDLLRPGIEFAEFLLGIGFIANGLSSSLANLFAITDEALRLLIPLPSRVLPEFIRGRTCRADIKKPHLRLEVFFRRHVTLRFKGRHIVNIQLVASAL